MLTKRITPCLDIKDGRTVKGTNFINLRDAGDPVELGAEYARQGADELVFLDITATHEKRKTLSELVSRIAHHINIPFTVGGGISSIEDVSVLLQHGADKISVNTSAFKRPELINELSKEFGSQCVVVHDGTKAGFSLDITGELTSLLPVPIIASGGAGTMEHFTEVFEKANADAALAASIFHFREISIPELKTYLAKKGISVRL